VISGEKDAILAMTLPASVQTGVFVAVPQRRHQRHVTLTAIAQACGVAPSTVSRALSNPNRVSSSMYERIASKAREMGYFSALLPAVDERRAHGTIALVLPNLTNLFLYDLVRGSQGQAQTAGYFHLLVSTNESPSVEAEWLAELSHTVDGIVIVSPRTSDDALRSIADAVPVIVVNREIESLSGVVIDTPVGAAQAMDYLTSLGHRCVAYVRGPENSWTDHVRYAALCEAAQRHDAEIVSIGAFHPSLSAGAAAADAVSLSAATAAVFFNDTLAIGALGRFRQRGIRVPEDISVIGCDDVFGSAFATPPLTTITTSGERAGRTATEILIGHFATKDHVPRVEHLAVHLTVRESTGPAPTASDSRPARPLEA
jgi:DNA-binding LacI/PurR family transcriptional regulator